MDEIVAVEYEKLFGLTSKGKTKVWQVSVIDLRDGTAAIDQTYGELSGKLQTNRKIVREGKNLGKANETSVIEQANSEAESKFVKKRDQEGYSLDKDNLRVPKMPMLALKFNDRKKDIIYPAYVQIKIDGCRCFCEKISDTEIIYTSRKGKPITTLGHITSSLLNIMSIGQILDGEVYCHGLSLQKIMRAVKKQRPESLQLEFWMYDIADPTAGYAERYKKYSELPAQPGVVQVPAYLVNNEEEIHSYHSKFVAEDKEGIMIKNCKGGYKFKSRSKDLLKLKNFEDSEFEIIGYYDGKGTTYEGLITFTCKTAEGVEFGCNPKGTHEAKKQMWQDREDYIGRFLTVRYQGYTDEGSLVFPVGVGFRDGAVDKAGKFTPDY